ncbi:S8 family peptidase [Stackebrandtia nassauensis]|uniref:Peptidase S8 and S53 subtilisin kexin sedolisin n=1 Tax=Stackebrandtia nassauensis (strain DSM 44728 / CIP 108903 / NRRL B-16338 / NBRC 102104 / LLR-40K-21) TaxID=446470 RepID=D3PU16_STANL|nr:S8 family peptidase [Stackebrandtia nassauensis]ADD40962.1 peptidase S8 and S53 subtilisin kexin sedolisin [Stackebrandtia nassauensis DSM 44728]
MSRSLPRRAAPLAVGAALALVAGTGIAYATDDGTIRGADAPDAVDGRYIVVLDEDVKADDLASRYGGVVTNTYRSVLTGFSAAMSRDEAEQLAADPAVDEVRAVQRVQLAPAAAKAPANLGLDRIDQRELPLDGQYTHPDSAGDGTKVYVIDTGVRFSHKDFEGRASSGPDFVDDDDTAEDCQGNGTALAGIAAGAEHGVAKKADVVGVRVLDCDGGGTTDDLLAGIDWVTEDAAGTPAVATLGLGGPANDALDKAVAASIGAGISYALPAGGSGSDACRFSPGRTAEALTVGGTVTDTDARSERSNTGKCLDLFAPSTGITSASHSDDSASVPFAGTAAAAAHVAGAAALFLADNPEAGPATVSAELTNNSTPDVVTDPGEGSPNLLLYTGFMNSRGD